MIWCVGSRITVAVVVVLFLGLVAACCVLPVLREVSLGRGDPCVTPSDEPAGLAAEHVFRQPPEGAAPDGEPGFRPACENGGPASYFVQYTSRLDDEQLARYYTALAGDSGWQLRLDAGFDDAGLITASKQPRGRCLWLYVGRGGQPRAGIYVVRVNSEPDGHYASCNN